MLGKLAYLLIVCRKNHIPLVAICTGQVHEPWPKLVTGIARRMVETTTKPRKKRWSPRILIYEHTLYPSRVQLPEQTKRLVFIPKNNRTRSMGMPNPNRWTGHMLPKPQSCLPKS